MLDNVKPEQNSTNGMKEKLSLPAAVASKVAAMEADGELMLQRDLDDHDRLLVENMEVELKRLQG